MKESMYVNKEVYATYVFGEGTGSVIIIKIIIIIIVIIIIIKVFIKSHCANRRATIYMAIRRLRENEQF